MRAYLYAYIKFRNRLKRDVEEVDCFRNLDN